jgi:hypothetical protein
MWTEVTPDRNWQLWVKKPDQPAQTIYQTKFLLFGFWNPVDGSIYFSDILKGIVYRADASQYTNPQPIIHFSEKNGPGVQIIGLKH